MTLVDKAVTEFPEALSSSPSSPGVGILSGSGSGRTQVLRAWHARLLLSAVQVDKEDVLICAIAGSGLLEVTGAGAAHSCQVWERQSRVSG